MKKAKVIIVGDTPFAPAKMKRPSRILKMLQRLRFSPKFVVLLGLIVFVWLKGWPSLRLRYEYRQFGERRVYLACTYFRPDIGSATIQPIGDCPIILPPSKSSPTNR